MTTERARPGQAGQLAILILIFAGAGAAGYFIGRASAVGAASRPGGVDVTTDAGAEPPNVATLTADVAALRRENEALRVARAGLQARVVAAERAARQAVARPQTQTAPDSAAGTSGVHSTAPEPSGQEALSADQVLERLKAAVARGGRVYLDTSLEDAVRAHAPELQKRLADWYNGAEDMVERTTALLGLAFLGDRVNLDLFREVLATETASPLRRAAARGLSEAPDASSLPLLRELMAAPKDDVLVRSFAAVAAGKIPGAAASAALREAYSTSKNGMVEVYALRALTQRGEPENAPFFADLARNESARTDRRRTALEALVRAQGKAALPTLDELAATTADDFIRDAARRAAADLRRGQ